MDFSLELPAGHVYSCPLNPQPTLQAAERTTTFDLAAVSRHRVSGKVARAHEGQQISAGHGHPAAIRSSHTPIENELIL
ncbi:hypothetical protein IWX64_001976 [Arthrobacter sp. CAN_A212]|uniref:hypothetical protein n=1 Tax=unclassified Arthrobacter TaxID=235627 RepID=UPI0018C92B2B|nr:hypothetical protein [Arthrobacter sp. CAN_C5]MBP2214984.1 hypothetical protein [Arthrobacter sp. CAN_C5]